MGVGASVIKRTLVSFYDDQMTPPRGRALVLRADVAVPAVLLAPLAARAARPVPETYDAIMEYAREVAPESVVTPLDSSLQRALQNKGTAATGRWGRP
jgi:hypothetical protein